MTLPQIALRFPGYFFWAVDEGVFEAREHLCAHAKMVARTATRIPIPKEYNAEYLIDPQSGKFVGLRIVHISLPPHIGSTHSFRRDYIDLSVPYEHSAYDKSGDKLFVNDLKREYWKKLNRKLTKTFCEEFFSSLAT